jgi:putative ABC transport system permease protein
MPLINEQTVFTQVQRGTEPRQRLTIGRWQVSVADVCAALLAAAVIAAAGALAFAFLRSNLGLAMCATGDNPDMIRALGVNVGWMTTLGLAISNALVAFSGALLAQYQGFADVQMGIGMVVWGFASVIIGESLVGSRQVGWMIVGAVLGSILFRLLVAIALRWGLNPNDLKLITALFVFGALVLPGAVAAGKARLSRARAGRFDPKQSQSS